VFLWASSRKQKYCFCFLFFNKIILDIYDYQQNYIIYILFAEVLILVGRKGQYHLIYLQASLLQPGKFVISFHAVHPVPGIM